MRAKHIALLAMQACEDKKALDIMMLDVRKLANFTHYFVIASGTSDRQVKAIGENVVDVLRAKGERALHREGHREGQWVLVDFGDVIVHVFLKEMRSFYSLERLWGDAKRIELPLTPH